MTGSGAHSTFRTKASSTFLACSLHFNISDAYGSDDEMTLRFFILIATGILLFK